MNPRILLALCIIALLAGPAAGADVVANFTDGNHDDTYVDAYHGIAGNGWKTPWIENTKFAPDPGGSVSVTNTVINTVPVNGGGNYLSSTVTSTDCEYCEYGTGRDYTDTATGGIDVSVPFRIEFTVRIDENMDLGTTFNENRDRYLLYDSNDAKTTTSFRNSWSVYAHGAEGTNAHAGVVGDWAFYNGNNNNDFDGSDPAKMIDTDITLTTGGLYDFSITIDPKFKKWNGTVSDGTDTFSRNYMGWRTVNSTVSPYLYFATKSGGSSGSPASDTREWSIDSIALTQLSNVPTTLLPTVAAYFDGGGSSASPVTNVVDAYTGTTGDGWRTPWIHKGYHNATGTVTVLSTSPLKPAQSSGNYAQVDNTHPEDQSYAGLKRNYKAFEEGIDWTKEHTIQFSIRLDEDLTAGYFNHVDDRYQCSDVSAGYNTDSTASWMVSCYGGTGSFVEADDVGVWVLYNGGRDSGSMEAARNVPTTLTVTQGTVYDFTIVVDPVTQSYDAVVTDGTTTYDSKDFFPDGLGWRRQSTEIGGYLMFDTRAGDVNELDPDHRIFSLDDVLITQIIEEVPGDTDDDGDVDKDDLATLAGNWGASVTPGDASAGDFDGDGIVGPEDASILAAHWGYGTGEASGTSVPEPCMAMLVGMGLAMLAMRRTRR